MVYVVMVMVMCVLCVECLEELGILIQNNGMIVCGAQPQKTVPLLAGQISDRDNTVRSAALNTMVVVYSNMGEGVYKFTSQVRQGGRRGSCCDWSLGVCSCLIKM